METVLGTKAVVRKRRELWAKDNAVFNLDTVEGIGQVLEVEVQQTGQRDIDAQLSEYQSAPAPFAGPHITASNEDLVLRAQTVTNQDRSPQTRH